DPTPDGIVIEGRGGDAQVIGSGEIAIHHDHRIAMSFAMAGLRAAGPITIRDIAVVDTSFPGFAALARGVGLAIEEQPA
ncbi:MAG TPA: 3-phosphoshikimate 1-carboxyvinyltransferase, partial [Burkholderiaceae bacterium]|nr:3-phosphoshikimate 1-carboxyvinyltransferase [Burkholderiaceae bacterium]